MGEGGGGGGGGGVLDLSRFEGNEWLFEVYFLSRKI